MLKKIAELSMAAVLAMTGTGITKTYAEGESSGKYVSDVYFAYGETEEEAVNWLKANGWEPIQGNNDFNAGKNSVYDSAVAVAMGIKRTDAREEAITDMAILNMKGGYSFADYEELVNEKRTEIDEFINSFIPAIREYRDNYNGNGSSLGKARADFAYTALNLFVDGNPAGVKAMMNSMGLIENELRLPLVPARLTTFGEISTIVRELNIKY